jgi:hypothetical protein
VSSRALGTTSMTASGYNRAAGGRSSKALGWAS